ncbi:XK-related protein 6-like [Uloborus diversus]|uniref:XK-related protein 6-like n=1 Tax=Uloborus diversus TaxID=327109 RepID=UPI00240939CC|nr:XK-related protein 6-like [Uloborus diversus]
MDIQKMNGSSLHAVINDFDESDQEVAGKTRVLVHQNAMDLPELPKKDSTLNERPFFIDPKPVQKICPSEIIEPDDIITPLSEESSPTGTGEAWEIEKPSLEPEDDDSNSFFEALFPCCGSLIDPSKMTYGRFLGLVICFLFYVGNIASDIAVCCHLFYHDNMLWFALVAAFTLIPTVILNSVSYHLSINKMIVKRTIWNETESSIVSCAIAVLHLTQFGVLARYLGYIFLHELEYLWVVFCPHKKRKSKQNSGKYLELRYVSYLFIVEAIFQCLPQLIVQLYILIDGKGVLSSDTNKMLMISIAVSLLNLSRLLTLCKHLEKNFTISCCGLIFIYLWFLFTNISRIVSFTLFLTKFAWGFAMLCIFHWIIMSLWSVNVLTPSVTCGTWKGCVKNISKYVKGLIFGIMYILCFMKLKISDSSDEFNVPTRYLYAFFYSVLFLENSVVTILWFMYSENVWYRIPAVVVIFMSFFIGIFFLYSYYRYFHRNVINHPQRWRCVLLFPMKNHS